MSEVILHIGYSKAGSTFLKEWFNRHPEIYLGGIKDFESISDLEMEPHFEKSPQRFVLSNHVFNLFDWDFKQPLDKWLKTPNLYAHQNNMSEKLHELFPTAKILFVTRGFESILKSFYSEYVKTGGVLSFYEMLTAHNDSFLQKAYNYDFLINLYIERFGRENVVVLPYEMLKNEGQLFVRTLEKSLNISNEKFENKPVNPAIELQLIGITRRLSAFTYKTSQLLGQELGDKVYGKYMKTLLSGKFNFFLSLCRKLVKYEEKLHFSAEIVEAYKGNATVLKTFPHFANYYKDYLIDD